MIQKAPSIEDILHEYERTRLSNERELDDRKEKIYKLIPRIEEIDQVSKLSYISAVKARLQGQDTDRVLTATTSNENRKLTKEKEELLVKAGYPVDYLKPIFTCKHCHDTGYINGVKCSCFREKIVKSLYLESNLNEILLKENFDTFSLEYYSSDVPAGQNQSSYDNMRCVLEKCKAFANSFDDVNAKRGNIFIYGETGLGKTFLSNCIAKQLLDNEHTVLYLSANELFETILSGYIMKQKNEFEELYKFIFDAELLIIDDMGTELTNNFVLSYFYEIINKRGLSGKSTLISTNLSMKQFRDRYTERIMSRIVANYTVFSIYGDNIRYQKRKKSINATT